MVVFKIKPPPPTLPNYVLPRTCHPLRYCFLYSFLICLSIGMTALGRQGFLFSSLTWPLSGCSPAIAAWREEADLPPAIRVETV